MRPLWALEIKTLFFWISNRKPEHTGPGIGPHLQPNSMMCMVCTLLWHMKDTHDWRFSLDKDFNFEGGLTPCLNKLIWDRKKEVRHDDRLGANRSIMQNVTSVNQLDWSVFDESDPIQHAQKVMGYFGCISDSVVATSMLSLSANTSRGVCFPWLWMGWQGILRYSKHAWQDQQAKFNQY